MAAGVAVLQGIQGDPLRQPIPELRQGRRLVEDIEAYDMTVDSDGNPRSALGIRQPAPQVFHPFTMRVERIAQVFLLGMGRRHPVLAPDFLPNRFLAAEPSGDDLAMPASLEEKCAGWAGSTSRG